MQIATVINTLGRASKSHDAHSSLLKQNLQTIYNSDSRPGYRIDSNVQIQLDSVKRLLTQLNNIGSKLVHIRSSKEKGVHFSANSSMRANLGLRGNMGDVHKELRLIGAEIKSPRASQELSAEAMKKNLLQLQNKFEANLEIKIPTKQDNEIYKASLLRRQKRLAARDERNLARRAVADLYGSNKGAAWMNNLLREQSGTLRPGMTIEKPTAGDVAAFYRNSLAGTGSAFSVGKQQAVAKVLNLQHQEIQTLLKKSLGNAEYGTYYRGARLSNAQLASYQHAKKQNAPVAATFFMSVSESKKEASDFTEPKFHQQKNLQPVTYVINGSAHELKGAFETESLFTPGSQFKVTNIMKQSGSWQIKLEQLADNQKSRNPINI